MNEESDELPRIGFHMRDLMEAVGETLVCWGFLETAIRERTAELAACHGLAKTSGSLIQSWLEAEKSADSPDAQIEPLVTDIRQIQLVRNLIAHGISSATANPYEKDLAFVTCRSGDGADAFRDVTILELRDAQKKLRIAAREVTAGPAVRNEMP